ncbi:cellular tumor antigen p53-like isoform X3 [Stylophora pistillata]|uniref:cellular tumor antigen p53-like isoform X3 n=1 Tax=Stylophora pistillata TaxID=50429 RepID=UPI000C04DE13|nr:cellular tumor antigen p53-like isoform X3 [Stylophora pistillata]
MSQPSSQGSNYSLEPLLSQETLEHVFTNVNYMFQNQTDLQSMQTQINMVPTVINVSDENIHESVEMNLESVAVLRPEQGELLQLLQEQQFQNLQQQPGFKQEPLDNTSPLPSTLATPPPEEPSPQPLIVCNTDFPGLYGFGLGFEVERSPPTKSAQWTYSPTLEKLFVKMRCIVPIRVKLRVFPPAHAGFYIRVVVIYRQPDHYREIVERCPNHRTKHKDGHPAPEHLLRCENPNTIYVTCPETGRHSLKIPLETPQAGSDFVTNMFQFMCFSSCPGGLNRRPILVIFTLEQNNIVVGRKAQNIRICACPGRDRTNEEIADAKKQSRNAAVSAIDPQPQPVSTSSPNVTPPPTPQASPAPQTSPQEPSTSTAADDASQNVQVPKLTKKRSHASMSTGFEVRSLSIDRNAMKRLRREEDEEIFTIQVRGHEKYELLLKMKEGLDMMDMVPQAQIDNYRASCPPCGRLKTSRMLQNSRNLPDSQNPQNSSSDSQNSMESQPDDIEGTPPVTQLSRSDSGSSYQSPSSSQKSSGGGTGFNAVRFTLRRTVSLDKKGFQP